jgi:L-ornithine N5-monooxygenase
MSPSAIVGTPNADPRSSGVNGSSRPNGLLNGSHPESPSLIHPQSNHTSSDDIFDLVCVGFGPASLAVAIALHDMYKSSPSHHPKVLFLEKQAQFAWHAGMQLPGAKMQISFLKDLATPRDPTSKFTFLNYLLQKGRLHHFINLGTFLPSRMEYEDYLRWCASFFAKEGCVEYGMDVERVGVDGKRGDGKITNFVVCARRRDGEVVSRRTRHVVIAVGGRPVVPPSLQGLKHVHHSSQFANAINKIQEQGMGLPLKFAVIGGGQSAAEIFNDIWARFPGAKVRLIIKDSSLRPSDDSPL